ncbi:radical SAM protein [Candidatus Daviesbacteria bacterium]|nr:radical SAM protein [Candidatus Daviesbacteria bacterium]
MKLESDIRNRMEAIGVDPTKLPIRQLNYLPFKPLNEEISEACRLSMFRRGYSPRLASVKLTDECNLACLHCNANKMCGRQLSTEEIFKILDNLKRARIQNLDLTGGEPTLRKDLFQIIKYASKLGLWTTLNTNGGIVKDEREEENYWRDAAEVGLRGVNLSFDGMFPKNDPRVIDRADYIRGTLHIYAGIRTVVTQDNLGVVEKIGEMCMLNSIFFQAVPAVDLNGRSSGSPDNFHSLDEAGWKEYVRINRRLAKVRGPFAEFLHMSDAFLKEVASAPNPNNAWHCKNPSAHWISVDAQGNARVCNDVALPKAYSLTGKENPLLTKEFHEAVTVTSEKCGGCSWFCHWEGNRKQSARIKDGWRYFVTTAAVT